MIRSMCSVLFGLVVCGSLACTSKPMTQPTPTAHGYTFSLRVSDTTLWLGSQSLGDLRPGVAELTVEVRDVQGQHVEGLPVTFHVAPSWVQSASLLPQHTLTHEGTARAVFEPRIIGLVQVMAQVNGQTQTRVITVELREFGNSGAR
jgi:hypothetical protein